MLHLPQPAITQTIARHALAHFGYDGGQRPGLGIKALFDAIAAADAAHRRRFALGFPGHVAAVEAAQSTAGSAARLQRIAAGVECGRCDNTDGPWIDGLCEPCHRTVQPGGAA